MSALDIDTRADIYSVGVLLYELLTGHVPFETKDLLEAGLDQMRRILREQEPVRASREARRARAAEAFAQQRLAESASILQALGTGRMPRHPPGGTFPEASRWRRSSSNASSSAIDDIHVQGRSCRTMKRGRPPTDDDELDLGGNQHCKNTFEIGGHRKWR